MTSVIGGQNTTFLAVLSKTDGKSLLASLYLLLHRNKWHQPILHKEIRYFALFQLVSMTDEQK